MRHPSAAPVALATLLIAAPASAQSDRASRFMDNCQRNRSDSEMFCETRNATIAATRALSVDGRQNGGITVHAWDKNQVQVLAMVQAQAETENDAREIARNVVVSSNAGEIRADGPSMNGRRNESWSVSYEIWVPRTTDLTLNASNGGLAVDGVASKMTLSTVNGGISLRDVGGDIHGSTTNGGITADLSGEGWQGAGLDLRTTNGGVNLSMPTNYSAQLETGTTNGRVNVNFPLTVTGDITRRVNTTLGRGGAPIRVVTMNGGVSIKQR
jgi:DUF4097 and DUF4098 domain-containing protein YvlB